jgi:NADH-quinone oxidoreductase subunit H
MFFYILFAIIFIINILLLIAIFTYLERKILGVIQLREGPNVVGFLGLLQPIADAIKLLVKETLIPRVANKFLFFFAPFLILFSSFFIWIFLPLHPFGTLYSSELTLLFIFFFSSLNVYSLFIAGWSTNSKYGFLGAVRSISQMISYEIIILLAILPIVFLSSSISLDYFVYIQEKYIWFCFISLPSAIFFLISIFAETNRAPFDLPEAEAELVAGYNVDYSSFAFACFFLGEYSNMITMVSLFVSIFLGGVYSLFPLDFLNFFQHLGFIELIKGEEGLFSYLPLFSKFQNYSQLALDYLNGEEHSLFFSKLTTIFLLLTSSFIFFFKVVFMLFVMVWVRATWPRLRYDQLMSFCWKHMFPLLFSWYIFFIFFCLINKFYFL